jgi:hypothetical protein
LDGKLPDSTFSTGVPRFMIPCNGLEVSIVRTRGAIPKPTPIAMVVGCSDARVPTELLFVQGFNDLFVIRVTGALVTDHPVNLAYAPTNPRDFNSLAIQVAERLHDTPPPSATKLFWRGPPVPCIAQP